MPDHESPTTRTIFKMLDAWRHLPGYRLEGRLAPFFELFLLDILSDRFPEIALHPVIIPEFPLRIRTLFGAGEAAGENQSCKVDYAVFSADLREVILVELKTDMSSRRDRQDEYLRRASETPFGNFVLGIRDIAKASHSKRKYVHLLHRLGQLGLVSLAPGARLYDKAFPNPRRGWTDAVNELTFTVRGKLSDIRIVYIQPESEHDDPDARTFHIGFKNVARVVQDADELGAVFARFLNDWACEQPSSRDPRGKDFAKTR